MHLLILGLGYTTSRLGEELVGREGWRVSATVTALSGKNGGKVEEYVVDKENPVVGKDLRELLLKGDVTHIVSSIPPNPKDGSDPILLSNKELWEQVAGQGKVVWAGYLS